MVQNRAVRNLGAQYTLAKQLACLFIYESNIYLDMHTLWRYIHKLSNGIVEEKEENRKKMRMNKKEEVGTLNENMTDRECIKTVGP